MDGRSEGATSRGICRRWIYPHPKLLTRSSRAHLLGDSIGEEGSSKNTGMFNLHAQVAPHAASFASHAQKSTFRMRQLGRARAPGLYKSFRGRARRRRLYVAGMLLRLPFSKKRRQSQDASINIARFDERGAPMVSRRRRRTATTQHP
jgi:hypothetical protein